MRRIRAARAERTLTAEKLVGIHAGRAIRKYRLLRREAQNFPVVISKRPHPIPSRTRKLSSSEPMVLHGKPCGRVGRRRDYSAEAREDTLSGFCFLSVRIREIESAS